MLVWSPLAGGFLSGKYRRDNPNPEGARRTGFDFPPIDRERGFDAIDALDQIANQKGASVAQIALAWLLAQPGVASIIIGANKMTHSKTNLHAVDVHLSTKRSKRLSATTSLPLTHNG